MYWFVSIMLYVTKNIFIKILCSHEDIQLWIKAPHIYTLQNMNFTFVINN